MLEKIIDRKTESVKIFEIFKKTAISTRLSMGGGNPLFSSSFLISLRFLRGDEG